MRQKKLVIGMVLILIIGALSFNSIKNWAVSLSKEVGYQFSVDGEQWFIVDNKEKLEKLLEEYKQQYNTGIDENAQIKSVEFQEKVEIAEVEVFPEEIVQVDAQVKEKIYAKEKEATYYEVQSGDNLWNIAKENNLGWDELETLNPDIDPDKIFPGDKLVIDPFNPVLDVVVTLENTIQESIPFKNEYLRDSSLFSNQKRTVKEGQEGIKEVTYDIQLINGFQSSLEVKSEKVLKEPVPGVMKVGTKTTVSRGGKVNYGVVQGKRVSSSFGWRTHPITGKRSFHDGVDIPASYGNGVYAYTEGKVIRAGWDGGYGYSILVDHGNGLKTRYAHLSKIYVRAGQRVSTGAKIGAVGSTGNSTGPHLHFEVIKNGSVTNPFNYI